MCAWPRRLSIYDTATLTGGDAPTGTITFKLYGPDNAGCTGTPAFTDAETVNGNGSFQSGAFPLTVVGDLPLGGRLLG